MPTLFADTDQSGDAAQFLGGSHRRVQTAGAPTQAGSTDHYNHGIDAQATAGVSSTKARRQRGPVLDYPPSGRCTFATSLASLPCAL